MTGEGIFVLIDAKPALRFERTYRQPIERVWRAISEPDEVGQWFPSDVEGERTVGAELVFNDDAQRAAAREAGEPTRAAGPRFRGTVVTYDPPNVFSFTWGGELLRFELTSEGDETILVFTHLLSHQSVAARNGAGWHDCLLELDRVLGEAIHGDGDPFAVYDEYVDRMGPDLGTPTADGSVAWERSTHVDAARVRVATSDPDEIEAWGGNGRAADPVRWDVEPTEHGSLYRLTVEGIGRDAAQAATWHALLLQLDMYLAAGQLVPADPERWVAAYEAVR